MKFLYMPLGILAAVIGQRTGRTAFQAVWSRFDGEADKPPSPRAGHLSLAEVAGGAALEAATIAAVAAVIDQLAARVFHHLFGAWPEKPREPAAATHPTAPAPEPAPAAA